MRLGENSREWGDGMRYDTNGAEIIRAAAREARLLGHGFVGTAHLLLALTCGPQWPRLLLESMGVHRQLLQDLMVLSYGQGQGDLPLHQGFTTDARKILQGAGWEADRKSVV